MQSLTRFFSGLSLRWWLLPGVFLLLWNLSYAPFWNPDEGRYASAALEMAQPFDGSPSDWVMPYLNSIPRLNKPPLVYWLGAASYRVFGVGEASARLIPALASLAVMIGLWTLGRSMFGNSTLGKTQEKDNGLKAGERAGVAAALIWATSLLPAGLGRTFNTDMLLCAAMFFVFGGIFLAGEDSATRYGRIRPYLWSGIGMGLALVAKGPVGVALPLLIGAFYLTLAKRWSKISFVGLAGAVVLALLLGAPWYLAMEQRVPGFIRRFVFEENLGRFSGKGEFHDPTPFWYYLPIALFGVLPWTSFFIAAVARARSFVRWDIADPNLRGRLFCWLWCVLLIGFFSLSSTKLVSYILPAFPALALLLGESFGVGEWPRAVRRAALVLSTLFSLILGVAATVYLTNDNTLPRAEGLPYAIAMTAILLVGALGAWLFRGDRWKIFGTQALTAIVLLCTLLSLAGRVTFYEDASPILRALAPQLQPDDRVVLYRTFQPSAIFYTKRTIPIYEFRNNSGLDETHPNYKKLYLPRASAALLNQSPQRVFVLVRWTHDDASHFRNWQLLAHNNDFRLLSNRTVPGFKYDFTAPKKRSR
ncbi:MAG TPA: glycosyltransferase family 39 protein [Abditibacteriaceae bacterium]|jgi:4-amino-4-deoxy-L-arabinose transferase-like glycosyltransferase